MNVTAYALGCSVCDHISEGRRGWLEHLLELKHQHAAKQDVSGWSKALRKCAVVVFANFPVACYEVLEYFSKGRNIVTDFVAIPSKSNSGILQFESREKVKEVIAKFGSQEIRIRNELVQLKKVSSYLELEWKQLIQEFEQYSLPQEQSFQLDEVTDDTADDTSSEVSSVQSIPKTKSKLVAPQVSKLDRQYSKIRTEIEISDTDYNNAMDIMEKLGEIFGKKYPNSKFYMYRDWYLKLQTSGENVLRIFFDHKGELSGHESKFQRKLYMAEVLQVLESPEAQRLLPCIRKQAEVPNTNYPAVTTSYYFVHSNTGLQFHLENHPYLATETQTCRLLKYMISFDPRAELVLMLVHYWAKLNDLKLSNPDISRQFRFYTPEPAALEWLVVLFLCQKLIIPTPREILTNPEKKTIILKKHEIDIGFDASDKLITEWKKRKQCENSILDVLELLQHFFAICSSFTNGVWILNTRDGEIISEADFCVEFQKLSKLTKMTAKEVEIVRESINCRINILHPLNYQQKFRFNAKKFDLHCNNMILVADRLTKFISAYKDNPSSNNVHLDLEYVFKH